MSFSPPKQQIDQQQQQMGLVDNLLMGTFSQTSSSEQPMSDSEQ
jgi:hypothetical protein